VDVSGRYGEEGETYQAILSLLSTGATHEVRVAYAGGLGSRPQAHPGKPGSDMATSQVCQPRSRPRRRPCGRSGLPTVGVKHMLRRRAYTGIQAPQLTLDQR